MTSLKSYINKNLGAFLVLILLSTSVLSASHVHDSAHLDSGQVEQCLAYHVADHQQAHQTNNFNFGEESSYQVQIVASHSGGQHQHKTPPARAPPLNS